MNSIKTIVIAASAGLSLCLMQVRLTEAAIITYDFTVNVNDSRLPSNTYSGNFSYDDSVPSPAPGFTRPFFDVTDFNFNFAGKNYTKSNLQFDCRGQSLTCYPLFIPGGEVIATSNSLNVIPRGGTLKAFQLGNFNGFTQDFTRGLFLVAYDSTNTSVGRIEFLYSLPGDRNPTFGSLGSLSQRSVPEPGFNAGIAVGMVLISLSFFKRRKYA